MGSPIKLDYKAFLIVRLKQITADASRIAISSLVLYMRQRNLYACFYAKYSFLRSTRRQLNDTGGDWQTLNLLAIIKQGITYILHKITVGYVNYQWKRSPAAMN